MAAPAKVFNTSTENKLYDLARQLLKFEKKNPDHRLPSDLLTEFENLYPDTRYEYLVITGAAGRLRRIPSARTVDYLEAKAELMAICHMIVDE